MKWSPGTLFSEQVSELTRVFSQWNECEQTVVLYALLRRIPAVQARFLAQAVHHSLHAVSELDRQESDANNPAFINSLLSEPTEVAINQLLTHLPLLRPGDVECKQCYLAAIPELVNQCSNSGLYIEQVQQLLGYTLIHPAITSQDRRPLTQWLRHIEEKISASPPAHGLEEYTNSSTRFPIWENSATWQRSSKQREQQQPCKQMNLFGTSQQGTTTTTTATATTTGTTTIGSSTTTTTAATTTFNVQFPPPVSRQRRSNSLTPPVAPPHHLEAIERSNNANSNARHKPRSFSVSGDNSSSLVGSGPLSPQSSCASSGSEGRLDEASTRTLSSGMRDVPAWLKTLRLHKYSYLFATMAYEEMLELTEEQLAEQGVTKGARHKLALSITKLQQRYTILVNLEKDLLQPTRDGGQPTSFSQGSALLVSTLDELNAILATPLKPSQETVPQDIPGQFTRVLGKLCSRLALEIVDDGVLCGCIGVLEKVLQHDCFTPNQKEKVQQWRSRLGNPRPAPKWQHNYSYGNRRFCSTQQHGHPHSRKPSLNLGHVHNPHQHINNFMISPHRNSISTPYLQNGHNNGNSAGINQNNVARQLHVAEKRPSLQETSMEILQRTLQRTYSAPRDHFVTSSSNTSETTEPEINSRLESLCLRMTEQAIGGFGEA